MRKRKHGTLKRGKGGRGGKVKSRKQAIAIGLSEARKKGKKVPKNGAGSDRPGRGCQRPITHEAAAAYFSSGLEPLTAWRTTNCREA
jgi:hypothetical protein